MKRSEVVVLAVLAALVAVGSSCSFVRARDLHRRIYFGYGEGLYYIRASEYRGSTVGGNTIVLRTDRGEIVLDLIGNQSTLEKIAELKRSGDIRVDR